MSTPAGPTLAGFTDDYIRRRGKGLSAERADTIRATVRDFVAVVGDKALADYGTADVDAFEEVMLALPANWQKKKALRDLGIKGAAEKAKELGLPRQSARTFTRNGPCFRACSSTLASHPHFASC